MIRTFTFFYAAVSPGQWSWAIGLLLIMIIAAIILLKIVRKWVKNSGENTTGSTFSLEDLRKMRDAKQISEQEYKTLRDNLIMKGK